MTCNDNEMLDRMERILADHGKRVGLGSHGLPGRGATVMMTDRLQAAIGKAREHLEQFANPHDGMSPDGYAEAAAAADALREVLAAAEPENWCPPHHYHGMSTDVRGQAVFTCHMCGHLFVGNWADHDEGYADA